MIIYHDINWQFIFCAIIIHTAEKRRFTRCSRHLICKQISAILEEKVGFSKYSSNLIMLLLKFIVMNTLHSFLDPTVYLLCRKVCEYKSNTGIKYRSERKFPCKVQSKMHFFCNLVMKIGVIFIIKKTNLL